MIFVPIYHKSVFKNPFSHLTHIYTLAYKQVETKIESLENSRLISGENGYVVCNATYSVNFDTTLHWKIQHTEKSVLAINPINNNTIVTEGENFAADPVSLSPSQLSGLCQEFGPQLEEGMVAFSINYAPTQLLQFNSEEYNRALVQRQLLVLVMCNVGLDQIGTYTCIAPGSSVSQEQSMDVSVYAQNTGRRSQVDTGAISAVVVVALVIIVVIFLLIYFGVRRYRQLKYEAMQMRPMSIPLAATQLTNAINQAFASFSPIGSPMYDKFEFPRENLMLLEVIGELLVITCTVCISCRCVAFF